MVMKMLTEPWRRMKEQNKNFNKEKNVRKYQIEVIE